MADPYTPEIDEKIAIAKEKKDLADQSFKTGDVKNALWKYHEAILYLKGIYKNESSPIPGQAPPETSDIKKPKTEADEILVKIYSNMSACHIKQGNWKRAIETADKALAKDSENQKALFRKGKALGELGFFEKAEKLLSDLLAKDSADSVAIQAELVRLKTMDKEREKAHNKKMRGWLSRDKGKGIDDGEPSEAGPAAVESARIEEIVDDLPEQLEGATIEETED